MKAQTITEYILTYGWAILIILIVAGVLAYYGVFQPSAFLSVTKNKYDFVTYDSDLKATLICNKTAEVMTCHAYKCITDNNYERYCNLLHSEELNFTKIK
jgi:hypothetical protein